MIDILPPNASRLERRLAATNARIDDVPTPLATLMNPDTIRSDLLPWLAWHLGVDAWKDYWPEYVKRARAGQAIPIARRKGTAASVREVVAAFGGNIVLREWFEQRPPGRPGTFDLVMTVSGQEGQPPTAEYVADILAEIDRTKPVRAHYTFTQGFEMRGRQLIGAAARVAAYRRLNLTDY
ncbi:phage tail protein I [Burkholderia seminalis]|uniref:Phage tail protein I n=2 Tax=Burkholderia cepacia complex TaxID=87882 RepID=A0A8A8D2D6_9BURK|nr:phage tail protein I [Burkholderia seminalis]MDN7852723.1 phage tail protein I [Burkholderia seminalis]QTO18840.1 phage tail protein I [Burkholderia seminalis]